MVKSKELPIERPSRACPASRYLNPRGHMQRDCRRSPNANRLSTRSLPSSPYSITFFHPESNRVAGRSERVCFLRRETATTSSGERLGTRDSLEGFMSPRRADRPQEASSRRFQKAKKAGSQTARHSNRLVIQRKIFCILNIRKLDIFCTFFVADYSCSLCSNRIFGPK